MVCSTTHVQMRKPGPREKHWHPWDHTAFLQIKVRYSAGEALGACGFPARLQVPLLPQKEKRLVGFPLYQLMWMSSMPRLKGPSLISVTSEAAPSFLTGNAVLGSRCVWKDSNRLLFLERKGLHRLSEQNLERIYYRLRAGQLWCDLMI